jgi:hypothetical protein
MNANRCPTPRGQQTITVSESPLFNLGHVVATPGALKLLEEQCVQAATLLNRHVHGDWCDMVVEDQKANIAAVKNGGRVFSSYCVDIHKIWVITEAVGDDDATRASTCILLPKEY